MPPKTEIKDRTLYDLQAAIRLTVEQASTPEEIDAGWQTLHCPARDALSLVHWRSLIAHEKQERVSE